MPAANHPVSAPAVLDAIDKAFASAHVRPLASTQRAVLAGVLAVYLEKARHDGAKSMVVIAKSLRDRASPGDGILRFGGKR